MTRFGGSSMNTRLDSRPIRVDSEVFARVLAKKAELEFKQGRVITLNDALRALLEMETDDS